MSIDTDLSGTKVADDLEILPDPIEVVHIREPKVKAKSDYRWVSYVTVGVLVAFGIFMRAWILRSPIGAADSDESVVGLMALALLNGDPSVFYWGQAYGGSQESVLVAAVFSLFGTSVVGMKLVPVILSATAAVVLWRIGKRTVGDRVGAVGAALFWAAPFAFVWLSTKERGFYEFTMLCGLVVMLCALKMRERPTYTMAAIGGLALGLGVWASPQVVYLAGPSIVWLIVRRPSSLKTIWVAVPAAIVGLLPAIKFNLDSDWSSFDVPNLAMQTTFLERLRLFFTEGVPQLLGVKVPYTGEWTLPVIGFAICALAGVGMVFAVLWCLKQVRVGAKVELLVLTAVCAPFIFAASPYSFYVSEPRYLYFAWAPVALLIAWGLRSFRPVGALVAMALCVLSMTAVLDWHDKWNHHDLTTDNLAPVVATLDNAHIDRVYGDYWVAYRITLDTDQRIVGAPVTMLRRGEIQSQVDSSTTPPSFVMFANSPEEQRLLAVAESKEVPLTKQEAGNFVIYTPEQRITPTDLAEYQAAS